jgi:hypothetical protein
MAREVEVAYGLSTELLQHLVCVGEVAERLRHLLAVEHEHSTVQPEASEWLLSQTFCLGDLVLVMREDEVVSPCVNVKRLAEETARQGDALSVPARSSFTPGGIPLWLTRLGRLPQREVERILLLLRGSDPRTDLEVVDLPPGELPVAIKRGDAVVHIPVHLISQALIDQGLDQLDHLRDMLRCAWAVGRWFRSQGIEEPEVGLCVASGDRFHRIAGLERAVDQLIINVGHVLNVGDIPPFEVLEVLA